ncbi:MAG TPA: NTP transferase domain-containing protein [Nevskiaceae bacterium]|nr:NTP transferase domain-containing protein [Nevskiaceae bacterium]
MHAILLAAGRGKRLSSANERHVPKSLLSFGGHSLLERHLRLLRAAGVDGLTIVTGYASEQIRAAVAELALPLVTDFVDNARYTLGSVLSVHCAREGLVRAPDDVLVMDADVLYDQRILLPLCAGPSVDRVPFDTGFTPGDEPVKLCLEHGRIVEFRKRLAAELHYDRIGETIGFFRLTPATARRFAELVAGYVAAGRTDQPHEEALRDLFLEQPERFEEQDTAPAPWLEIDFPEDLVRARDEVLPKLERLP